jgi:hypothetical protein
VEVGKVLWIAEVSVHGDLVIGAGLFIVEAGLQIEDRTPVLDCHNATGCKASAITNSVDLVKDGLLGVAWAKEVRMQRMHVSPWFVDGASSSDQGLACDLTAEDAYSVFIGALPSKDIDFNGLKVQQLDEIVECPLTVCRRR